MCVPNRGSVTFVVTWFSHRESKHVDPCVTIGSPNMLSISKERSGVCCASGTRGTRARHFSIGYSQKNNSKQSQRMMNDHPRKWSQTTSPRSTQEKSHRKRCFYQRWTRTCLIAKRLITKAVSSERNCSLAKNVKADFTEPALAKSARKGPTGSNVTMTRLATGAYEI